MQIEILLYNETQEVGIFIEGYIAKNINKKVKCPFCNLLVEEHSNDSVYFYHLSREALTIPSPELSDFDCKSFGFLDYFEDFIVNHKTKSVRLISSTILRQMITINFTCDLHKQKVQNVVISIVVNIFFNNKRRLLDDGIESNSLSSFKKRQRIK